MLFCRENKIEFRKQGFMACVHLRTNYSFHRNGEHSHYFNQWSTKNRILLLYKPRMTIFSAKHPASICNKWNFSRLVLNDKSLALCWWVYVLPYGWNTWQVLAHSQSAQSLRCPFAAACNNAVIWSCQAETAFLLPPSATPLSTRVSFEDSCLFRSDAKLLKVMHVYT